MLIIQFYNHLLNVFNHRKISICPRVGLEEMAMKDLLQIPQSNRT